MIARRYLFLVFFLALVVLFGVTARYSPDWEWLVHHEESFRDRVAAAPLKSWLVGVLLYTALSLVPGTAGKSVVCGWLFGFLPALLMVEVGLTSAALISFSLSRFGMQEILQARWRIHFRILRRRFQKDGAFYLLLLRFAHAPFTLVNYGAGAIGVPFKTFWWTTHLGILPGTMVFTLAGARVPTLQAISEQGIMSFIDAQLIIALLATFVLALFIRPAVRALAKSRSLSSLPPSPDEALTHFENSHAKSG